MARSTAALANWPLDRADRNGATSTVQSLKLAVEVAREEYRSRRRREKIFGSQFFSDPVWDMLLDLFIATAEGRRIVVSSACIAAEVPRTTALRQIKKMEEAGLLSRRGHPQDSRCTLVTLTDEAYCNMIAYFEPH